MKPYSVRKVYTANFYLLRARESEEIISWCDRHCGDMSQWWKEGPTFHFLNRKTYTLFLLRWGDLLEERKGFAVLKR
jgi:hypothetical protein